MQVNSRGLPPPGSPQSLGEQLADVSISKEVDRAGNVHPVPGEPFIQRARKHSPAPAPAPAMKRIRLEGSEQLSPQALMTEKKILDVRTKYLEIGTFLGLPADFLLSLQQSEFDRKKQCLNKVLEMVGDTLTIESLKKAIDNPLVFGAGNGASVLLTAWAEKKRIPENTVINHKADLTELIQYLLSFQGLVKKWIYFGYQLGIVDSETRIIEEDITQGLSSTERLFDALEKVEVLTIETLVAACRNAPINKDDVANRLTAWAKQKEIAERDSIREKNEFQELKSILRCLSPHWENFSAKLGVKQGYIDAQREKNSSLLSIEQQLSSVFTKAFERGLLTKENLTQAICCIRREDISAELRKDWGMELSVKKNKKKNQTSCSEALADDIRKQRNPIASSVYTWLYPCRSSDLIGVVLNFNKMDELLISLLKADRDKTLDLNTLARLSQIPGVPPLPEDIAGMLQSRNDSEATASRVIQMQDLIPFLALPNHHTVAIQIAALTGNEVGSFDLEKTELRWSIDIWERILQRLPFLQTGHLKNLLEQHEALSPLIAMLPAGTNTEAPSLSLKAVNPYCGVIEKYVEILKEKPDVLLMADNSFKEAYLDRYRNIELAPLYKLLMSAKRSKAVARQLDMAVYLSQPESTGVDAVTPLMSSESPSDDFMCPISLQPMSDPVPVMMDNGVIKHFSKKWLLEALSHKPENPLDRSFLDPDVVRNTPVNEALKKKIAHWASQHEEYKEDFLKEAQAEFERRAAAKWGWPCTIL